MASDDGLAKRSDHWHGSWDETGSRRYCRACEEWVGLVDWMDHREHGNHRVENDAE